MRVLALWVDIRLCLKKLVQKEFTRFLVLGWIYRPNEQAESEINCGLSGMPNR